MDYDIYAGGYIGTVNKNLLVLSVDSGEPRHKRALQYLLNQGRRLGWAKLNKKLLVMPKGKTQYKHRVRLPDLSG